MIYYKENYKISLKNSSEKSSEKILNLINKDNYISAKEISNIIWISSRAVEKNLKKLKEKWIIKRIWPDRWGYWEIISH